MNLSFLRILAVLGLAVLLVRAGADSAFAQKPTADLVLKGEAWTGDPDQPRAEGVAVREGRILAVGDAASIRDYQGPDTDVIEVSEGLIIPGFIDNHTHFNRAGALLLGINLLAVNDADGLVREVRAARDRLPEGAWIQGGDWGAYAQWEQDGDTDAAGAPIFEPHRDLIDDTTPETPVLLSRFDGEQFLANALALQKAELTCADAGVECEDGRPTGRLTPEAAQQVRAVIPETSMARHLAETDTALARLRANGVTGIHDITTPEQMKAFQTVHDQGDLTVRVYARPTLDKWRDLDDVGIQHGFEGDWLRIGGLKGFVDGILGNSSARFYESYEHTDSRGQWRDMMDHPDGMQGLIKGAAEAGHWPQIHAIGDQAIDTLLTMYENVRSDIDASDQRWRVIHAQHLRGPEVAERMADLDVIAEVQPFHAIDDMRWLEERVGEDRARWSFAFNTLREAGVRLSFGSDWPGTNASWYPADPVLGIYAAVTRQTREGTPEGGWVPEERIDVETALRAYTVNNAYAAGEEDRKGTLQPGMLADITVLSEDITAIPGTQIKDVNVRYTIVDGQIVYARDQ